MANKWEFIKANGVYIYPSANADDGGDVNSEVNVSGISKHLIQKDGFVICRPGESPKPFEVIPIKLSGNKDAINVRNGSLILDGYYINLKSTQEYVITNKTIDSSYISNLTEFMNEYSQIRTQYYQKDSNNHIVPKPHKKGETVPELPAIHLVVKLIKDITGNVRGDLLERDANGNTTLKCKGCCWTFMTSDEVNSLTVPYLEIARIYPSTSVSDPLKIEEIIVPPDIYSYIYINSIYDENGDPLGTAIEKLIDNKTQSLPTITHYQYPEGVDGPKYKDLEISVEDGVPKVRRYKRVESGNPPTYEYDENGDYKVVLLNGTNDYNNTYSIDDIQKRSHPASSSIENPSSEQQVENNLAKKIDSRDTGTGQILAGTLGSLGLTNNGESPLVARADHDHDNRYIMNRSAFSNPNAAPQQVTKLSVTKEFSVTNKFTVDSKGNIINNPVLNVDVDQSKLTITGDLDVTGTIRANKVYNAVWNDYAELYKKEFTDEEYEEGTVICKVPGKDTYAPSDYSKRKLVIGVVSNSYGHLLGGDKEKSLEENLKEYVPISLAGRVPVKIQPNVLINEGDLLTVSSYKGLATTNPYPEQGTVIGKALESSDGTKDKILMQVMLG